MRDSGKTLFLTPHGGVSQQALWAVGAQRQADGGAVHVRQADEWGPRVRHVRQAPEPAVLHAAAPAAARQHGPTGEAE